MKLKGSMKMCKLGDIIVVKEFKDQKGITVPKHSFVVINDEPDYIEGFEYDFVSNIMCSFHDEKQKKHKLSIEGNLEIKPEQIHGQNINSKGGYIRADELFYFKKAKIEYKVIAHMDDELLDELVQLIIKLHDKHKERNVITNL